MIQTFQEKKQDGLLSELEKQPELGRFNFPGYMGPDPNSVMRLGTDIRYAMSFPGASMPAMNRPSQYATIPGAGNDRAG